MQTYRKCSVLATWLKFIIFCDINFLLLSAESKYLRQCEMEWKNSSTGGCDFLALFVESQCGLFVWFHKAFGVAMHWQWMKGCLCVVSPRHLCKQSKRLWKHPLCICKLQRSAGKLKKKQAASTQLFILPDALFVGGWTNQISKATGLFLSIYLHLFNINNAMCIICSSQWQ